MVSVSLLGTALRRHAGRWCATAVLGFLIGVGIYLAAPPPYQASTSLLLTQSPGASSTDTVQTDVALAQSRSVAGVALARLGWPGGVAAYLDSYTATAVTDRVLVITAQAPGSALAVRSAAALAAAFLQVRAHELQLQQQLAVTSLNQQITQARHQAAAIASRLTRVTAQASSPSRTAELRTLRSAQLKNSIRALGLQESVASYPVITTPQVSGSQVLDAAAPVPRSRFRGPALYGVAGLVPGLLAGLGVVIIGELVTSRLRRRDDVAAALRAPVVLSLPGRRAQLGGWLPGGAPAAAVGSRDMARIVAHLRAGLPDPSQGGGLAVVAVDDTRTAAQSVLALAAACGRDGHKVLLADLSHDHAAATLLTSESAGLAAVTIDGLDLVVAQPAPDDPLPLGPVHGGAAAAPDRAGAALQQAYQECDLLLTLVQVDVSEAAINLSSWASSAVVMLTAGMSSATKIHAVGELLRAAGVPASAAVLLGADPGDDSLGDSQVPSSDDAAIVVPSWDIDPAPMAPEQT